LFFVIDGFDVCRGIIELNYLDGNVPLSIRVCCGGFRKIKMDEVHRN